MRDTNHMSTVNLKALSTDTSDLEAELAARLKERQTEKEEQELQNPVSENETSGDSEVDEIVGVLVSQGVSREIIEQARDRFGKLYAFPFSDEKIYILRPILKKEWNLMLQLANGNPDELEIQVIKTAVIFPSMSKSQLEEEPAGLQGVLSQIIMNASGFIPLEAAIQVVRQI
jgi:hypothetical protein